MLGSLVLNGIGSLQYTGTSILMSQPEDGALVTRVHAYGRREPHVRRAAAHRTRRRSASCTSRSTAACRSSIRRAASSSSFRRASRCSASTIETARSCSSGTSRDARSTTRRAPADDVADAEDRRRRAADRLADDPRGGGRRDRPSWVTFVLPYTYVYDRDGEKDPDRAVPRGRHHVAGQSVLRTQRPAARRAGAVRIQPVGPALYWRRRRHR